MSFLTSLKFAAVAAVVSVAPAYAVEFQPFTQSAFTAAQSAGRPTLVHAHAGWCPICHRQQKTIKATTADTAYKNTLVLTIDYDEQKAEQKQFKITKQSTLIAFNGGKELSRISYDSDPAKVNAVIAQAK